VRKTNVLDQADVERARGIITASDDDLANLANLEVALNARATAPEVRVVLRMVDADLVRKVGAEIGH
jgi:voltage-gated potassium channel Kch